ncbi:MAG: hypothetical protein DMD60_08210 [Gemmatimonadetes bacterium]|nr:MAG: hypothetical protein DMD60_08210 [Gemmatimonadota bacterium]
MHQACLGAQCVALIPCCLKTSLVLRARSIAYFAPVPSTVKQPDFRLPFEGAPGLYLVLTPDLKSEARVNVGATFHFTLP